ncbi:hypothetical protein LINGRAHAP2_LOCUS7926, partial [Linum grandiflorum]
VPPLLLLIADRSGRHSSNLTTSATGEAVEVTISSKPIGTMLEKVFYCMNMLSSDYFKELYRLKRYRASSVQRRNQISR